MLRDVDFCDYETSKALKELGYREKTFRYYIFEDDMPIPNSSQFRGAWAEDCMQSWNLNGMDVYSNWVDCPTIYDAQRWFRKEKGLVIYPTIDQFEDERGDATWSCCMCVPCAMIKTFGKGLTYEEALKLGLREAVKFTIECCL